MDLLQEYTTPSNPGAFSGKSSFIRELTKRNKIFKNNKSRNNISEFLQNQETYTLHKPIKKNFKRNRVLVSGIDDTFQADLIDVSKIAKFNDDYNFILTCIDVFSKFAWAIPIKNKSSIEVLNGFKKIFSFNRIPKRIQTDKGNEFLNKTLKNYLKTFKNDIKLYTLNSEMKASVVERFNRTLKEKMWRYFTFKQSYRYLDVIGDLLNSYNNTYHRTIKTTPSNVNKENEKEIWTNIYGSFDDNVNSPPLKFKYNTGDYVRISKSKALFDKGYTANWTREIFQIYQRYPRTPPVYKIIDIHPTNPEIVDGVFYENQLQKINKENEIYLVEKILQERSTKKGKEVYIKWLGYPEKFNSWEPASNLLNTFTNYNNNIEDIEKLKKEENISRIELSV